MQLQLRELNTIPLSTSQRHAKKRESARREYKLDLASWVCAKVLVSSPQEGGQWQSVHHTLCATSTRMGRHATLPTSSDDVPEALRGGALRDRAESWLWPWCRRLSHHHHCHHHHNLCQRQSWRRLHHHDHHLHSHVMMMMTARTIEGVRWWTELGDPVPCPAHGLWHGFCHALACFLYVRLSGCHLAVSIDRTWFHLHRYDRESRTDRHGSLEQKPLSIFIALIHAHFRVHLGASLRPMQLTFSGKKFTCTSSSGFGLDVPQLCVVGVLSGLSLASQGE